MTLEKLHDRYMLSRDWNKYHNFLRLRDRFIKNCSFAIPTRSVLKELAKYSPIVEMGAGSGFWSYKLKKVGAKVVAFDNFSGRYAWDRDIALGLDKSGTYGFKKRWDEVLKGGPSVLEDYPDHTLMLCWPDYQNPMASRSLDCYEGKRVIYIGEGPGGCTGDDEFHNKLKRDWTEVKFLEIPQWYGIHDWVMIYERK